MEILLNGIFGGMDAWCLDMLSIGTDSALRMYIYIAAQTSASVVAEHSFRITLILSSQCHWKNGWN